MRVSSGRRGHRSKRRRLLDEVWCHFREYVKERDGRICFTCDAGPLHGSNCQAGHMISTARAATRYSPSNVHVQCFRCNIGLRGNVSEYTYRFIQKYGNEVFDRLIAKSREIKQWKPLELAALITALKRGGADYEMYYAEMYGI